MIFTATYLYFFYSTGYAGIVYYFMWTMDNKVGYFELLVTPEKNYYY